MKEMAGGVVSRIGIIVAGGTALLTGGTAIVAPNVALCLSNSGDIIDLTIAGAAAALTAGVAVVVAADVHKSGILWRPDHGEYRCPFQKYQDTL
ncbi:MAG: hypothetical protein WCD70_09325 [Alphaproteobacteria bacterium]